MDLRPVAGSPWSLLIYVDALSSTAQGLERAAAVLQEVVPVLTGLGEVTLLVVDERPEPWIESSRDRGELERAFAKLAESLFQRPDPGIEGFSSWRRGLLIDALVGAAGDGPRAVLVVGDANGERLTTTERELDHLERTSLAAITAALDWVAFPLHLAGDGADVAISSLAEETGGAVAADADGLSDALLRLHERSFLRFRERVGGNGEITPLSVVTEAGTVRAARWSAPISPDIVLIARANGLLGEGVDGDLDVISTGTLESDANGEEELELEILTEVSSADSTGRRNIS